MANLLQWANYIEKRASMDGERDIIDDIAIQAGKHPVSIPALGAGLLGSGVGALLGDGGSDSLAHAAIGALAGAGVGGGLGYAFRDDLRNNGFDTAIRVWDEDACDTIIQDSLQDFLDSDEGREYKAKMEADHKKYLAGKKKK